MNEIGESPELNEEVIEKTAEKSAKLIGKKILKWVGIFAGFAVTGLALSKVLAPEEKIIFVVEETGEVVDEPVETRIIESELKEEEN